MTVPTHESAQQSQVDAAAVPTRVEWAHVPRVNLLPPEIIAHRGFRRVQQILAGTVAATIIVIGGTFFWAQSQVNEAQGRLDDERAVTVRLQREQAKYADVPKLMTTVQNAETARQTAMATDIAWYAYLYDVSKVTPSPVWLTSLTASVPMPGASSSTTPTTSNPVALLGAGTLVVTGQAPTFTDVAAWLDAVDTVDGLEASVLDTAVLEGDLKTPRDEAFVTFTSRITVTSAAFTHRYDRKAA